MRVGLINIGDEILAGKILNTNARELARWLGDLSHEVAFMLTVADGVEPLAAALRQTLDETSPALPRCGMLILSGGLGPTHDDLTRDALAAYLGAPLERSEEAAAWLAEFLRVPAGDIGAGQALQLLVPRGAAALRNTTGTACGIRFERNECAVFAFPGVPREFRALFDAHCRPLLENRDGTLLRRRAVTFGLPESRQRDALRGFTVPEPFRFSSLPNATGVTLALETFAPTADVPRLTAALDAAWNDLLSRLPTDSIVDREGNPLPQTVFRLLQDRHATVSCAESCTAGFVGYLLTELPGSSVVFEKGFLTYSNEAKRELLGVDDAVLRAHGAVSQETALAMARGCRAKAGSDYAVAVTGIAGPDGGTPEKPVGLVYVAAVSAHGEVCARHQFREDRDGNRRLSAYAALNQLRLLILKEL
ncbi:MAG TPA: nicotinamide-nucleotide amidohydrolase family protein [Fibrobacteria bacterium]|nr:nicotinamide-nucleotide amidohydrolase family protein [Fibrobacteria bacterium]